MVDISSLRGKKILLTGHTGFKGSWLSLLLLEAGAEVTGIGLAPGTDPALFEYLQLYREMKSYLQDVSDLEAVKKIVKEEKPEIVLHLAAQPLVRESYQNPAGTYLTNVMGTVNVLEAVRLTGSVKSFLNITTDKVYKNHEWEWGYRENEELCGYDPYSNSKSCSELVTYSYQKSFFQEREVAISTARAGNVLGGGDFSADRIIPDCYRAAAAGEDIIVRNPHSTRPYQHVLEPLTAYLMIALKQLEDCKYQGNYNIGPDEQDCVTTGTVVDLFCEEWKKWSGAETKWINRYDGGPHEANFLKLDCAKAKKTFGWRPVWHIGDTMEKTVEWYAAYNSGKNCKEVMLRQIKEYMEALKNNGQ